MAELASRVNFTKSETNAPCDSFRRRDDQCCEPATSQCGSQAFHLRMRNIERNHPRANHYSCMQARSGGPVELVRHARISAREHDRLMPGSETGLTRSAQAADRASGVTRFRMVAPSVCSIRRSSYCRCRLSQSSGPLPSQYPSRTAVSTEIDRFPARIWETRFGGTSSARASSAALIPKKSSSSFRISPG